MLSGLKFDDLTNQCRYVQLNVQFFDIFCRITVCEGIRGLNNANALISR